VPIVVALIGLLGVLWTHRGEVGAKVDSAANSSVPAVVATSVTTMSPLTSPLNAASSGPSEANTVHYLDELPSPSLTKGCGMLFKGSYVFGGGSFERSVANKAEQCMGGGPNYFEYDLDITQQCYRLDATLGVPRDELDYVRAYLEIMVDGRSVGRKVLARNQSFAVSAEVKPDSVVRLTLINQNTQYASGHPYVTGVFGDARLTCRA
jgi:hypothetical protein